MAADPPAPLGPEDTARLTEFARAFKAAARAVVLYPPAHPAIGATLGRIVALTSTERLVEPLRIGVLAEGLVMDERAPARPDAAIAELAALLHTHLIGELTVHGGGDLEAWRSFLVLLGRAPDAVRAEGGMGRLWAALAGRHVELREIDYSEVLRERSGGTTADWDAVIKACLLGDATADLSEEAWRSLIDEVADPARLAEVMADLDARAIEQGHSIAQRTAALVGLLRGLVESASKYDRDKVESIMRSMASAIGRLPPEMMHSLLSQGGGEASKGFVHALVDRITDATIASFVARNATSDGAAIDRVAQAFHTLVPDPTQRAHVLELAHEEALRSPLGSADGFEDAWDRMAEKLLTSYSDKPFVSEEYARELTSARTVAIEVEQTADDPPERISAWLSTVATSELRKLDLTLVLDLLRIEQDPSRWSTMMRPVVSLIDDLLLVGDFEATDSLLATLLSAAKPDSAPERRLTAMTAIDALVKGPALRHMVSHLQTIDDAQFERVKTICVSLGDALIRPLADAIAAEEHTRPRERLSRILLAFGASGRREAERLKTSPSAAVRRTAIHLLREFGGSEALPELTELLADNEPQVQREAVRAIVNIGSDAAFKVLQDALMTGTEPAREAIMQSLGLVRDERIAPLFTYVLGHVDHRGPLASVYLRAIEGLGGLKDPEGVAALKQAIQRGEWWAPRRTAALRDAAASALARMGTAEAVDALEEVASSGPRGARAAAKAHLAAGRAAIKRRETHR